MPIIRRPPSYFPCSGGAAARRGARRAVRGGGHARSLGRQRLSPVRPGLLHGRHGAGRGLRVHRAGRGLAVRVPRVAAAAARAGPGGPCARATGPACGTPRRSWTSTSRTGWSASDGWSRRWRRALRTDEELLDAAWSGGPGRAATRGGADARKPIWTSSARRAACPANAGSEGVSARAQPASCTSKSPDSSRVQAGLSVGSVQTPAAASKAPGGSGGSVATRFDRSAALRLAVVLDVDLHAAALRRRARAGRVPEPVLDRRTVALDAHARDRAVHLEVVDVVARAAHVPLRQRPLAAAVHAEGEGHRPVSAK